MCTHGIIITIHIVHSFLTFNTIFSCFCAIHTNLVYYYMYYILQITCYVHTVLFSYMFEELSDNFFNVLCTAPMKHKTLPAVSIAMDHMTVT